MMKQRFPLHPWMTFKGLSGLVLVFTAPLYGEVTIMDPTHNNGSFENPVANDHDVVTFPGWSGGTFEVRRPGYLVGHTDGQQSIHIENLVEWQSDLLTTPLVAGSTVTMSLDFGWDSWINQSPAQPSVAYLYAVNPQETDQEAMLFSITGQADYNGFGTDAGWKTFTGSGLVQNYEDGWYLQVVNASGGFANQMFDNYVITSSQAAPPSEWNLDGSGDWNTAGNWTGDIPNGVDAAAALLDKISNDQTITTDIPITLGMLQFDNSHSYTIGGAGSLTISSSTTGSISVAQGSHNINVPLILASNTNISVASGATLTIGSATTIKANTTVNKDGNVKIEAGLTIEDGGVLNLSSGPALSMIGAPILGTGAKIDVQSSSAIVKYTSGSSPLSMIQSQIITGYANGAWTGAGITSSDAATEAASADNHKTAIGFADNSVLHYTTFGGQDVTDDAILIRYTYTGDADLDGTVGSSDFDTLAANYGATDASWQDGDFNYDGTVNALDFNALATNYGLSMELSSQPAAIGAVVPEPGSLSILALTLGMGLRCRRASCFGA